MRRHGSLQYGIVVRVPADSRDGVLDLHAIRPTQDLIQDQPQRTGLTVKFPGEHADHLMLDEVRDGKLVDGESADQGYGVAVDASGNAYVAGTTWSSDFPTVNPIQAAIDVPRTHS